jgi:glycosyltransferase involved in cell wall biosynthesis
MNRVMNLAGETIAYISDGEPLRPGISVCVAAHPARFRGPQLLTRALASVVTQTLQPSAIHVVNDIDRQGAGWTRRTLLDHVDTEWTAWLDSDDEWMPEHLEKLHRVAVDTDSVYVFSWFTGGDPLGHFSLPFNPCTPHHTTMNVLVGFPDNATGPFANEDWAFITGVAKLACERGLKMTHLAERTWHYYQAGQNTSGQPGQGDAR